MIGWLAGKALSPFGAVLFLGVIRPFTHWLRRRMPDGRLKRILFMTWR